MTHRITPAGLLHDFRLDLAYSQRDSLDGEEPKRRGLWAARVLAPVIEG